MSERIEDDLWLHRCNRCSYKWTSRSDSPGTCANKDCRSPYWNKPRVKSKQVLLHKPLDAIIEPENIWLAKAEDLKKSKKFEESIMLLDRARDFKEEKKGADYWYQRGLALTEVRKYEEALDCFDKDSKLNKASFETLFEKAVVLFTIKKYKESVECFNKAWEIKHADFLKLTAQSTTLTNQKKFEKFVLYADKAKNVSPIPKQFWHYKGLALHELKKYDEAIESFKEALIISPNDAEIIYDLSKSHLNYGDVDTCLELLEQSCKLDKGKRRRLLVDENFEKISDNKKFKDIRGYKRLPA